jgi:mRNA interferase RelE/StbE
MSWKVEFLDEAKRDMHRLDGSQRTLVVKAIQKVSENPTESGYGKPLGSKGGANFLGLFKIKLRKSGIRIVYQLVERDGAMLIVVVGMRTDSEVYREAAKRMSR